MKKGGHIRTGNRDAAGNTDFTNAECTKAIVDLTKSVGRPIAYGNDAIHAALANTATWPNPSNRNSPRFTMLAKKDPTGACP